MAANAERGTEGEANVSRHLSVAGRVNLGSFYTPAKYVEKVAGWLRQLGVDSSFTIADLSCGYGAFFELHDVPGLALRVSSDYFAKVQKTTDRSCIRSKGVRRMAYWQK